MTTPPGWYDDGHGAMRWWDGSQWTEHAAQPDSDPVSAAPTEAEIVAASEVGAAPGAPAAPQVAPPQQAPYAPPAAYPAPDAAPAGGFTAATEPRGSKLWILWVVLGVVLLGIVIAAAVVIPLLLLNVATSNSSAAGTDDERAAVAAVQQYDDAWQSGDCEAFAQSTTDRFREASGFGDCDSFAAEAQLFDENFDEYVLAVDEVTTEGEKITVTTTESFVSLLDAEGNPVDPPAPGSAVYHYVLVPAGDGWAIDDLTYE